MAAKTLCNVLPKPSPTSLPRLLSTRTQSSWTASTLVSRPAMSSAASTGSRVFSTTHSAQATSSSAEAKTPAPGKARPHSDQDLSQQLASLVQHRRPPQRQGSRREGGGVGGALAHAQGELAHGMGLFESRSGSLSRALTRDVPHVAPPPLPVRLDAHVGRSVEVTDRMGLGAALRLLYSKCAANKIATTASAQRFHERPGLKRKRLRRVRWRKRFMEGFQATVGKVDRMRRMGW